MASGIQFTPDAHVQVHQEGAIRLLCAQFRSHEDGLPEWLKNSSDQYTRLSSLPPEDHVIVLLLQDGSKTNSAMVGCLDFGGMSTSDIEDKFRRWADPEAAGSEAEVEGGHGNGGKCYMTQLFADYSYIHTLSGGRGSRYGFVGSSPTPGYFPSMSKGRGFVVGSPDSELSSALKPFGLKISDLPQAAQKTWAKRKCFTLVLGVGAKQLSRNRIPAVRWIENLQGHQQAVGAIQRAKVYVLHNREVESQANPIQLEAIEPIPGAERPRIVTIPSELVDPVTNEKVETGSVPEISRLELRTSNKSMRYGLKARHTISGWTHAKRTTGFWEVPALSRATYSHKIFGDVFLDALADYTQNDRRNHSDGPLTRAMREWLSEQIDAYSSEFVKLDELQATKEEQRDLSLQNAALNRWKNDFLDKQFGGVGSSGQQGVSDEDYRKRLPKGQVERIVLIASHFFSGVGVSFQPRIEFYGKDGNRVRPIPHKLQSSDWAVATVDSELRTVTTFSPGKFNLVVTCPDSDVRSNLVEMEVLNIAEISLTPSELEIPARSRKPISAKVTTRDSRTLEGVYLIWTENNTSVVSVGSSGMVFALMPGETSVTAADNQIEATAPAKVKVLTAEESKKSGGGFPQILLSEIDIDPLGETPPKFSNEDPPVLQRAQDVDANIWWINMASPLARRYIDTAKGSGAKSREWRVYLLERYIEIMVKIVLNYSFLQGEELTFETMLRRWEEEATNMQQRAMESLSNFLDGGEIGTEATDREAA
jgi:hypothetical protein